MVSPQFMGSAMTFSGSMVAVVTPMEADGSIDWAGWDRLIDFHIDSRTDALVVAGTTGESPVLNLDEIAELSRRAVARARGRMPVIVGTGTNDTASTILRTRVLSELGVDAVLIVTPYYNKPPQEGLFRHFYAAADASQVAVILYNVPSRTGVDLLPRTIARLAEHPRIVAVKDATGSAERAREILAACKPGFVLLSGDDATAIDLIAAGGRGVISVTANVAARAMRDACAAALAGDFAAARVIDARLQALHRDLFVESSPIPVKWAVARMGLMGNGIRLPLVELSALHHDTILRAISAAGVKVTGRAA
jgi:4-hydroxy-tetrahydrodipicolinate synthase